MATFEQLWQLLYDNGSSNYYKYDCNQIWNDLTPQQQQRLYDNIDRKLREGRFVNYNPIAAIHDNKPRRALPRIETLSYDAYYRIFNTTNAINGWEMKKDEAGKVYYAKKQQS